MGNRTKAELVGVTLVDLTQQALVKLVRVTVAVLPARQHGLQALRGGDVDSVALRHRRQNGQDARLLPANGQPRSLKKRRRLIAFHGSSVCAQRFEYALGVRQIDMVNSKRVKSC